MDLSDFDSYDLTFLTVRKSEAEYTKMSGICRLGKMLLISTHNMTVIEPSFLPPLFEDDFFVFMEFFLENSVLMYG